MKNIAIQLTTFILVVSLAACGKEESGQETERKTAEFYIAGLEALLAEDPGLNEGMDYIIIDFEELPAAGGEPMGNAAAESETAGQRGEKPEHEVIADVLVYLENAYGVETREGDMQTIQQEGLIDEETMAIEGILLQIEDVRFSGKAEAIMEGTKYKGGLGAIGLRMELKERDGAWSIRETEMLWIS